MIFKTGIRILSISILIFSIYSISHLQLGNAQIENWKRYYDPGQKFTFLYPHNWVVNSTHNDITGFYGSDSYESKSKFNKNEGFGNL